MAGITVNGNGAYIEDKETGLIIPRAAYGSSATLLRRRRPNGWSKSGVVVTRDETTGVWEVPGYGTGWDDYYMRSIVRGNVRNIGLSPTPDENLSSLVAKMQAMASTWQIVLTGRKTPVGVAREVIAQAQDSDTGPGTFIADYIGSLLVDNRGAFIAKVPFHRIAFDRWAEWGLEARPLQPIERGEEPTYYYLDMTTENARENRGLWMLDGLDCYPTGDPEWPFWYMVTDKDSRTRWVLIHRDFGGQLIYKIGPYDRQYNWLGQSPTWRYLNVLAREIIRAEGDQERMLNQPPDGVMWASGLDSPNQFREAFAQHMAERNENDVLYYPGLLLFGTVAENAKVALLEFSQPPAGYEMETWKTWREDALALCFAVSSAFIVTRIGTGSLTQSDVTDEIQAATGLAHLRRLIEWVFSKAIPPRIMVRVNYLSDRQRRFQVDTFSKLATAIKTIQEATAGTGLTTSEIRALIEREAGIDIPSSVNVDGGEDRADSEVVDDVDDTAPDSSNQSETVEQSAPLWMKFYPLTAIEDRPIEKGTTVFTAQGTPGIVVNDSGETVRVQHEWHRYIPGNPAATYRPEQLFIHALL